MKKITLLLLSISLFACSSDGDSNDNNQNSSVVKGKLKSITTDGEVVNFYYGSNGFVSKVTMLDSDGIDYSTVYNYEGLKLTSRVSYTNGVSDSGEIYTYSENRIIKSVNTEDGYVDSKEFQYDGSGKLTKEIYSQKTPNSSTMYLVSTTEFIYTSNNISKEIINVNGGGIYTITYEYDNKKNPYFEILPIEYLIIEREFENNKTKQNNDVFQYEYNSTGYPAKSISEGKVSSYQYY